MQIMFPAFFEEIYFSRIQSSSGCVYGSWA